MPRNGGLRKRDASGMRHAPSKYVAWRQISSRCRRRNGSTAPDQEAIPKSYAYAALPSNAVFAQSLRMDNETGLQKLFRWAKTPPQVYVVYLVGLILVWLVSFYAGTLNPKHGQSPAPPPVTAPRN
jgi:hypothetical protein